MEGVKQVTGNQSAFGDVLNASSATKDGQPDLRRYNHSDAWAKEGKKSSCHFGGNSVYNIGPLSAACLVDHHLAPRHHRI